MNYLEIYSYAFSVFFASVHGEFVDMSVWEAKTEECGRSKFENDSLETRSSYNNAKMGQFPWVARIGTNKHHNNITFVCGGSLVSSRYVITEAHCGKFGHFVRLGEYNIEEEKDCDECGICAPPPQDITVRKQIYGDDCSSKNSIKVMIMELEKPASFNDFVRPICIPKQTTCEESVGQGRLVISGWGQVNPMFFGFIAKPGTSKEMKYINSRILTENGCIPIDSRGVQGDVYCVDPPGEFRRAGHCVGDSGGPLVGYKREKGVTRAVLVGVARYNPLSCEMEQMPLSYSSLCKLSDWIESRIKMSIESDKK